MLIFPFVQTNITSQRWPNVGKGLSTVSKFQQVANLLILTRSQPGEPLMASSRKINSGLQNVGYYVGCSLVRLLYVCILHRGPVVLQRW